jgi:nicotinamidase-related amidase
MNTLLIIDPQNDFVLPTGALPVAGAVEDMQRLIPLLPQYEKIVITLDSHTPDHIATPNYWHDASGNPPAPFTQIRHDDVLAGRYTAIDTNAASYLQALEQAGKPHIIWPEHCVYGSAGWQVYAPLKQAIDNWLYATGGELAVHLKGRDKHTEMFSAVLPEVQKDLMNSPAAKRFLALLANSDNIAVAGEAADFCVKSTVADIIRLAPELAERITILTSGMSAIGDKDEISKYWQSLQAQGVKTSNLMEYIP